MNIFPNKLMELIFLIVEKYSNKFYIDLVWIVLHVNRMIAYKRTDLPLTWKKDYVPGEQNESWNR